MSILPESEKGEICEKLVFDSLSFLKPTHDWITPPFLVLTTSCSPASPSKEPQYWQMAKAATKATFPFIIWRENLLEARLLR
jgi:hypothetical protein